MDPSVPAGEFSGDNLDIRDLRLDRDELSLGAGLLFRLGEVELTAHYGYTPWGTNTAAIHSFSVGTIFAIADVTGR